MARKTRVQAALARAGEAQRGATAPTTGAPVRRTLVVGDPQASAEKFFTILEQAELLTESGWLDSSVLLCSIGDHFDYGPFETRAEAAASGLAILSWLAAHPPSQVTLIAGNHDLSRVAELALMDDATFDRAAQRAHELYRSPPVNPEAERAFLDEYPMFPSVEVAARDLCSFRVEQRELVTTLLVSGRFRLASSRHGMLLVHAGATRHDLGRVGLDQSEQSDVDLVAEGLNRLLDAAVAGWDRVQPFAVPGLFQAGSAARGEPGGFLFHRPVQSDQSLASDGNERRFDPRSLPLGLTQVVGHVRDPKCRQLLGTWVSDEAALEGALRHLETDGVRVSYAAGLPPSKPGGDVARLIFVDGGMHHVAAGRYQLLELPCF